MSTQLVSPRSSDHFGFTSDDSDGESLADRYQMLEELGSGSFGVVYKAIEKETGEIVAIKHVDLESSEEDLSDILSELSVLSSCSSPHVTRYKLAFLRRQTLWIVMEYLGGGSCADLLKPPPHTLNEQHIAIIMKELLLGLSYLHSEGKLHRDIKAANVLLGMDGRVKLADFGVAAQLVGLKSVRNTFVGTPFWMAPEVIQQEGHDSKADVWSLGITAMELANGQPPHANVHPMKVLFLIPKQPAPRLEGHSWSREFREFVALCLTKDVEKRPSAKDLLKHRFIRSAGKVENLQELIMRKQEYDQGKGGERNLKYYAETLRNFSSAKQDDEWVFETVKAVPTMDLRGKQTQKRRKVASVDLSAETFSATTMMEDMSLDKQERPKPIRRTSKTDAVADDDTPLKSSTMRRVKDEEFFTPQQQRPGTEEASPSVRRRSTKKRVSSAHTKKPLGVNMSFGNSPSTVRQFRRVSPNVEEKPRSQPEDQPMSPDTENLDPIQQYMLKKQAPPQQQQQPQAEPTPIIPSNPFVSSLPTKSSTTSSPSKRPSDSTSKPPSSFSSPASTLLPPPTPSTTSQPSAAHPSKESHLGTLLYTRSIGLACQTILDTTTSSPKREAISRLAEAFSDMESQDPEGLHAVMKEVIMRMVGERELREMLPTIQVAQGKQGRMGTIARISPTTEQSLESSTDPPQSTHGISQEGNSFADKEMGTVARVSFPAEHASRQGTTGRVSGKAKRVSTPQKVNVGASGLKMASNNPHLKSHRRRQSEQVGGDTGAADKGDLSRQSSQIWSPKSNAGIASRDSSGFLAGAALKEATKESEGHRALADVLFERWCDGLRVRWPQL